MTKLIEFTSEKRETFHGWTRGCRVAGVGDFQCCVSRGKSVRIPFKPRGQNRGWKWNGAVYENGRCIWSGPVPGSIGVRGLLFEAGVLYSEENDNGQ